MSAITGKYKPIYLLHKLLMMLKNFLFIATVLCACSTVHGQQPAYSPEMKAFHNISSNEIYGFVEELCHPKYQGRQAGSPEYMACAHWAANRFAAWGLKPGGDKGTYFQHFSIPYTETTGPGKLELILSGNRKSYRIAEDYFPGTNSLNGKIKAPVVYVGYGLTAPELQYDDYKGIDAKGKIVLVEGGIPCTDRNHKDYKTWNEKYISTTGRITNALEHGAAGVLLIGKTSNPNIKHQGIIFCHVSEEIVNDILRNSGNNRKTLKEKINKSIQPSSFETGCEMEIQTETSYNPYSSTCNVIAVLEGSDPELKDKPLLLGAHLDHLGNHGGIFRGAWDNASGSSIVLATAKAFGEAGIQPRRTIVFILFSAEECGILGSAYYVAHPLYPLEQTLCMINLDMVADGDGFSMGGIKSFPQLEKHFSEANERYIHRYLRTSEYRKMSPTAVARTDGATFNRADVPTFHTGTMGDSKVPMYYHDLRDVPETLDPEIMEDVAKFLFLGILGVTTDKDIR